MKQSVRMILERLSELSGRKKPVSDAILKIMGIDDKLKLLDIPYAAISKLAVELGSPNHALALQLWDSDIYEAKILAFMICDPSRMDWETANHWVHTSYSPIVCDYCCLNLLWKMPDAMQRSLEWAADCEDIVCYAGFCLISSIAANMTDDVIGYFDNALFYARKYASRDDIYVRRAVSMALCNIGKRSPDWYEAALETADEIGQQPSERAKWVASQTLADLMSRRMVNKFKLE